MKNPKKAMLYDRSYSFLYFLWPQLYFFKYQALFTGSHITIEDFRDGVPVAADQACGMAELKRNTGCRAFWLLENDPGAVKDFPGLDGDDDGAGNDLDRPDARIVQLALMVVTVADGHNPVFLILFEVQADVL